MKGKGGCVCENIGGEELSKEGVCGGDFGGLRKCLWGGRGREDL